MHCCVCSSGLLATDDADGQGLDVLQERIDTLSQYLVRVMSTRACVWGGGGGGGES
jgi:hypothetical protein